MRTILLGWLLVVGCGRDARMLDDAASSPRVERARFERERRPDRIVQALAIRPGSKVADIGAGQGLYTEYLAEAVAPSGRVIATDIEKPVLDLLHDRLARAGLDEVVEERIVAPDSPGLERGSYELIVPDTDDPEWFTDPDETASYDAILLADVDHFLEDEAAWLAQARRALAPEGRIVIANRDVHHRRALEAARAAGLRVASDTPLAPGRYVAILTR
ncbi:MAG TPA: class I SAM-dependent methyltransferase [Kofleriaceae bacterium]|nr:class I SAM-dependent methyltransferase [Kofleriaceae bacterium]